jgi:hypothetical protein
MTDNNQDLDALIRKSTQVDVPAIVEERLRRQLAEFRTRVERRPASRLSALMGSLRPSPAFRVPALTAATVVVVVSALFLMPAGSNASRVYAAAAEQFRTARSLQYTVVLAPYTEVEISYLGPGHGRVSCSWGVEVRTDGTGRQMVLMHATRTVLFSEGKQVDGLEGAMGLLEELKSLPRTADESLGERRAGDRTLLGYRVHRVPSGSDIPGLSAFDLWVDSGTGRPDHVDISIQEQGKPLYQMHIKNFRVDAELDRSLFEMTPPAGYTPVTLSDSESSTGQSGPSPTALRPEIREAGALTAVVVPMTGSYLQARAAVQAVESYLKGMGVTPIGPPFGRFGSEAHWDAGYPVPPGTRVEAPFEFVSMPATVVVSAVANGPWGQDSGTRWATLLRWVVERGYVPVGSPLEFWTGEDAERRTQSTEMRIAISRVVPPGEQGRAPAPRR